MIPTDSLIVYSIALIALLIGSYTDIKTREVPDWVNYGLIGAGLCLGLLFSVFYRNITFLINSIAGLALFFAIAWIMFYSGQWGGGDSKMLMGLGALIGLELGFKKGFLNDFLVSFFINALLAGAAYGILFSLYLAFKHRKKFVREYKRISGNKLVVNLRKYLIVSMLIVSFLIIFIKDLLVRFLLFALLIAVVATFYLWIFVKIVEKACMFKYVKPAELTEGDWIAKDVKINGKYITGPKDLGIEKSKIRKLIQLYKKKKVKKILIKEGIPFVPSFLIAFILTIYFGNLLLFFI